MPDRPALPLLLLLTLPWLAHAGEVRFARYPALSPDGQRLAFAWRGDLWIAPAAGGRAQRLTVHPAVDSRPVWIDGERLLFCRRHGYGSDIYRVVVDGGAPVRLTWHESSDSLGDVAAGRVVFASFRQRDLRRRRLFTMSLSGGAPEAIGRFGGHSPALSADGKTLVFSRGLTAHWRKGYRGPANHDLWLRAADGSFRQLTRHASDDDTPRFGHDGAIYFRSQRSGRGELWRIAPGGGAPTQISGRGHGPTPADQPNRGLRRPSVARAAPWAVAERWDRLVRIDLRTGAERAIELSAPGDQRQDRLQRLHLVNKGASELAISPDGKGLALVIEGDVFVRELAASHGRLRALTRGGARERELSWRGNHTLAYTSDETGEQQVHQVSTLDGSPLWGDAELRAMRWTDGPTLHRLPRFSPSGDRLAFLRGAATLVVHELASGQQRELYRNDKLRNAVWSPDGRWLALTTADDDYNDEVVVIPAAGGEVLHLGAHPRSDWSPRWSEDGRLLCWLSARSESTDVCALYLRKADDQVAAEERPALLRELAAARAARAKLRLEQNGRPPARAAISGAPEGPPLPAISRQLLALQLGFALDQRQLRAAGRLLGRLRATPNTSDDERRAIDRFERRLLQLQGKVKPISDDPLAVEIDADESFRRVRRIEGLPGDERWLWLSPDGETIYTTTSGRPGEQRLVAISTASGRARRLASVDRWQSVAMLPDGKALLAVDGGGAVRRIELPSGKSSRIATEARLTLDHRARAEQVMLESWRLMKHRFYDKTFRGRDWDALRAPYLELARQTGTPDELYAAISELLGELNGSHLGVRGPSPSGLRSGHLGLDLALDAQGRHVVTAVLADGPAAAEGAELRVGDRLLAIDREPLDPRENLARRLLDTAGLPLRLTIERGGEELDVHVRPVDLGTDRQLRYQRLLATRRARVRERSRGKLAYIHIRAMSWPSKEAFERDLYARARGKAGLLIDVRDNGGGWTTDVLLAMLTTRNHALTVGRGGGAGYPQSRRLTFVWQRPVGLLCNEASFSNAEIFSHAFRHLKLGPLVGTATHGGVISTGRASLLGDASIRIPFRGWYALPDRRDMEFHPAQPTLPIPLTPADEDAGRDPQLDAAIDALMK